MKILVVDDSKAMRMIVIRTLKKAGIGGLKTVEATDGQHALEQIAQEQPDFVLSDWNMPVMSGIELLKALRAQGSRVPLGFVTSESGSKVREEADAAGAEFVITKPFTPQAIEAALSAVIA